MTSRIRQSRDQDLRHRAYWATRPREGELVQIALGDSAGVGLGVDDPRRGYVGVLADRIAVATGRAVRTINLCVSGATAATVVRDQVPLLRDLPRPDVLTCVVGGNDVAWPLRFDAARFTREAAALASALPPSSVLGTVASFGHWPYEGRVRRANRALRAAADASGHAVADLYAPTRALGLARMRRILAPDWFHPNEAGHRLWADALWAPVTSALWSAGLSSPGSGDPA